jgi:hypothetical protein
MGIFGYRSYSIQHIGGVFTARPSDGDDLELKSIKVDRVLKAIDQLWSAIDNFQEPWIIEMIHERSASVDLDASGIVEQLEAVVHPAGEEIIYVVEAMAGER